MAFLRSLAYVLRSVLRSTCVSVSNPFWGFCLKIFTQPQAKIQKQILISLFSKILSRYTRTHKHEHNSLRLVIK